MKLISKLINLFSKNASRSKSKKTHFDEIADLFEKLYDKYDSKVMLKAVISEENKVIEVYTSNFKTTLNKSKKVKNEVIEPVEENDN